MILLSLIWAICSTCLVRPWFWKGVIEKDLFNYDGKKLGFSNDFWKREVVIEVVFFVVTFALSMFMYFFAATRQNLYGSFLMIIACFIFQCAWNYQGRARYKFMLTVAAVSAILWLQDGIVGCFISVPEDKVDSVPVTSTKIDEGNEVAVKILISTSEVKSLFKVTSASGPTYNNGKFIYVVNGGENGKGIVIIDADNSTEAKFLPRSYDLDIRDIRSQYRTYKLKPVEVVVSDDNVPYGLFAKADKTWVLGTYKVKGYILFNLVNGESQEYTQEELPNFVTGI
jgi:hypothetical protein